MTAGWVRLLFPTIRGRSSPSAPIGTAFSRSDRRERRKAAHHRDRDMGTRRTGNAGAAQCVQPADPSGAWSDRKDLGHVEALLWAPPHALAWPCQGIHSGASDSCRPQSQTKLDHHCRQTERRRKAPTGCAKRSHPSIQQRTLPAHRSHKGEGVCHAAWLLADNRADHDLIFLGRVVVE